MHPLSAPGRSNGLRQTWTIVLPTAAILFGVFAARGDEAAQRAVIADKPPETRPAPTDKTLVSWVTLSDRNLRRGSVLTIQNGGRFDGIVFAELAPGKWMAGSDGFQRTGKKQQNRAMEDADSRTLVQMAIVYEGNQISIYRNGTLYSSHEARNIDLLGDENNIAVFGLRHIWGGNGSIGGSIEDARIYARALSADDLKSLEPNKKSAIEPYAWWNFEDAKEVDLSGRYPHSTMTGGAKVVDGKLVLGEGAMMVAARTAVQAEQGESFTGPYVPETPAWPKNPTDNWPIYHLAHPTWSGPSPFDPNPAFFYKDRYHLHYIYRNHTGIVFAHVSSTDMVHWTWQPTKLQPSFTGHGMYSGTGFVTKEGRPAVIYHGAGSRRNQIAIAKDRRLSAWEKPFPVEPRTADGEEADIKHWDPDCFLIGDTYYAFSGGRNPPLLKSKDLESWTLVGDFLSHEPDDVVVGEDISCGNFFPIGDKWMLLCISHPFGCRYYFGDWDTEAEQFVPESHGRMNWRSDDQDADSPEEYRDFFAPESVLTADGRRVMWAWLTTLSNNTLRSESILSLPRELRLWGDGSLRIEPLRELEAQRFDLVTHENIEVVPEPRTAGGEATTRIAKLDGDAYEIRITVDREQAERKRFGFRLFTDENRIGIPVYFQPNNGTLRVGGTEAPFAVADLPAGEDLELRIFIDKYLVEVFGNGRQAMVAADMDWQAASGFDAYTWGAPTTIKKVEIWKMKPTNQGYLEARKSRVWEPDVVEASSGSE